MAIKNVINIRFIKYFIYIYIYIKKNTSDSVLNFQVLKPKISQKLKKKKCLILIIFKT